MTHLRGLFVGRTGGQTPQFYSVFEQGTKLKENPCYKLQVMAEPGVEKPACRFIGSRVKIIVKRRGHKGRRLIENIVHPQGNQRLTGVEMVAELGVLPGPGAGISTAVVYLFRDTANPE